MKKRILSIVLVLVFSLSCNYNVSGMEPTGTDIGPVSHALQEKENIANAKCHSLFIEWCEGSNYCDSMNGDFPSFYSGVYLNDDKTLVIQVTDINDEIINYFESRICLENTIFEQVTYSLKELKETHKKLVALMNPDSIDEFYSNINGVGLSLQNNAVVLYYVSERDDAISFVHSNIQSVVSTDNVEVSIVKERDAPCGPLDLGTKINDRSIGFWAQDSAGNVGIVTAPHSSIAYGANMHINGITFGTAQTPYFSGNTDAVFVKRTNSFYTPSQYVPTHGFTLYSGSYISPVVGTTIYSKGITSGAKSGVITDLYYTTAYGISNVAVTTATADSGDSGGTVAAGGNSTNRYLAGIITGRTAMNYYLLYIQATYILSNCGVTVC